MKATTATDRFLDECRYRGLSPATITAYTWALAKLTTAHPSLPRTPEPLMRLITFAQLAPESKRDLWRMLRRFYRWVQAHYECPNAMSLVPPPRTWRQLPRTLERSEIDRLLATTHDRRDRAMIAVVLDTGVRVGELAGLTWPSIKAGTMHVDGKTGPRIVPISPHVRQLLVGLGDTHHVWTGRQGPMTTDGVRRAVERTLRHAGFRPPKAGPHMLRHTFGRHYIMAGGDPFSLQRILGHRDLKTTMIYVHLNNQDLLTQHARFSPLRTLDPELATTTREEKITHDTPDLRQHMRIV